MIELDPNSVLGAMIKLENIHPLTDFKRNAKAFVDPAILSMEI